MAQIFDEQRNLNCFVNKLQGFAEAGEGERGAQHLVTVRHLVKRGLQLLDIEREAQVRWLYEWWERIDTWIGENRPVPLPPRDPSPA